MHGFPLPVTFLALMIPYLSVLQPLFLPLYPCLPLHRLVSSILPVEIFSQRLIV